MSKAYSSFDCFVHDLNEVLCGHGTGYRLIGEPREGMYNCIAGDVALEREQYVYDRDVVLEDLVNLRVERQLFLPLAASLHMLQFGGQRHHIGSNQLLEVIEPSHSRICCIVA